jgi:hypothetical protein
MKKLLPLSIWVFVFIQNVVAAPLVFKTIFEVTSETEVTTIATIDTAKYKQIRIGIKFLNEENTVIQSALKKAEELYRKKELTEIAYRRLTNDLNSRFISTDISFYALEELHEMIIPTTNNIGVVIDSPPSKIVIKAKGRGAYRVYVWAT